MLAQAARGWQRIASRAPNYEVCPSRFARFANPSTVAPPAKMEMEGWRRPGGNRYKVAGLDLFRCSFPETLASRAAAAAESGLGSFPSVRQNHPSADQVS